MKHISSVQYFVFDFILFYFGTKPSSLQPIDFTSLSQTSLPLLKGRSGLEMKIMTQKPLFAQYSPERDSPHLFCSAVLMPNYFLHTFSFIAMLYIDVSCRFYC
eukprot:GDKJ01060604.1.p2 GENE.GDKJ01060604.1~~GDKJ01060604.1.p2  ORF type:complete len:103 (-),score=7.85 GDKJ01060604.1:16-324(-)